MNCIVAVDKNWGIGRGNELLFHIPKDMEFFKSKTLGKIVVMGRNTMLSLPNSKPLAQRTNIVLSKTLSRSDCIVCSDLEELSEALKSYNSDDVFVIGGEMIYRELLPYCKKAYVTKVDALMPADKFFVNLDLCDGWELISQSEKMNYNGVEFWFCEYRNTGVRCFL
ncbi:MAG: dihydrofolate reductase [Acutalibacteraceae bacterium]